MPSVTITCTGGTSTSVNAGNHPWAPTSGPGSSNQNSASGMSFNPTNVDSEYLVGTGWSSPNIPTGATITGVTFQPGGIVSGTSITGITFIAGMYHNGTLVEEKVLSPAVATYVGVFGASSDKWGEALTPAYVNSGFAFGLKCSVSNAPSGGSAKEWDFKATIYYNDPTPVPTTINATGGSNQSANVSTQFQNPMNCQVLDQGGLGLGGVAVRYTLPASGPSGDFNTAGSGTKLYNTTTNANGYAASPIFFANGTAGQWSPVVAVTATPSIQATFYETNTTPPPVPVPTTTSIVQGGTQSATISHPFPTIQKVLVKDQFGAVMNNIVVAWNTPGSGASGKYPGNLTSVTSVTDASGIATAPQLTANAVVGTWSQQVYPASYPAVLVTFNFTNIADTSPPALTGFGTITGAAQKAAVNSTFAQPLSATVLDQYGAPFPGASVTFTIPSALNGVFAGGSTVYTNTSNSSGVVTTPLITAGGSAGAFNVAVSAT